MRQITIANHTNPNPLYNCTHVNAWAIAARVERWTRYNLLYLFKPPRVDSIVLVPNKHNPEDDRFETDMFMVNGVFADTQLNHYLELTTGGQELVVNAGFLLNRFVLGDDIGYRTLRDIIQIGSESQ